jgi:glycogen debranching enzyme
MPITLDRSLCCDLNETIAREWLVTNGLGGYAAGTVAGVLTRMQHGLLVAATPDAAVPQLLLAKIDEEVAFDQRIYYLGANEYRDGTLNPVGFVHLETFSLEEGFPVFTYRLGGINGITLEKRVWMPLERNTTCIQYRMLPTATARQHGIADDIFPGNYRHSYEDSDPAYQALTLTLLPFSAYRPYNRSQQGHNNWQFEVRVHRSEAINDEYTEGSGTLLPAGATGCTIQAREDAHPYHILVVGQPESHATFIPTGVWYWNFLHRLDAATGQAASDDLYLPGVIRATLRSDQDVTLTIIASTEELSAQTLDLDQLNRSYQHSVERQQQLYQHALYPQRYFGEGGEAAQAHHLRVLPFTTTSDPYAGGEEYLRLLLQTGDRHLIHDRSPARGPATGYEMLFGEPSRVTRILTDYSSLESRTRDVLISLPGLTLVTERSDEGLCVLREIAHYFRDGLLPDRLPTRNHPLQDDDYGSADISLWYFYALDHYLRVTRNYAFLEEFYPRLAECIDRYMRGTACGIQVDPQDGLLRAGQPGRALTWMNAIVDGAPVTPRSGKPVEMNALWYHALSLMYEWSQYLTRRSSDGYAAYYHSMLMRCKESFQQRFWYAAGGYLYDVVDGPGGEDAAIRPNQLFAFSLRHAILEAAYRQSVFDVVTQHLLTPYGLRTLAPRDKEYRGEMGRDWRERECALHQGSVWTWMLGPYVEAMLTMRCLPGEGPPEHESLYQEYLWRKGLRLLEPFKDLFARGLLGMSEGIFDGNAPHHPGPGAASAVSTAELLRIYNLLAQMHTLHSQHALSG